jgi:serine/threonine protein kinase
MSQVDPERFRIRREAGRGKRAVVHEAIDTLLHRPVALKVGLDDSGKRCLLEEGQRLARVRHRHVVILHDAIRDRGCLVLEWLSGQTLRQRLQRSSPLPFDCISRWTTQLLLAVEAAHAVDVLHGDIKPENIWIDANDRLKLFDFGATPRAGGDATALYAAAEVLRGEPHSPQSDLYGVGSVVFEMLTGLRRPADQGGVEYDTNE